MHQKKLLKNFGSNISCLFSSGNSYIHTCIHTYSRDWCKCAHHIKYFSQICLKHLVPLMFFLGNSGDSLPVIFVAFLSHKEPQYPTHDHLFSCLDSSQHCPRAFLIYGGWRWKRARFVCDICCICDKQDTPIYHSWPSSTSLDSLQHCPHAVLIGGEGGTNRAHL